jgi:predicted metal-dependent enzyme (double-stranded beta helix superfamily)
MKIVKSAPDGGKDSGVTAYFLIEWKKGFSIALLKFKKGSREAFHSHAFNALTWWLKGEATETLYPSKKQITWKPSFKPKFTPRDNTHKISARKTTWALTLRGPWVDKWVEVKGKQKITLTHGRKVVEKENVIEG